MCKYIVVKSVLMRLNINASEANILSVIDSYTSAGKLCSPSRRYLANWGFCSIPTVDRAVNNLLNSGLIQKKTITDAQGVKKCVYKSTLTEALSKLQIEEGDIGIELFDDDENDFKPEISTETPQPSQDISETEKEAKTSVKTPKKGVSTSLPFPVSEFVEKWAQICTSYSSIRVLSADREKKIKLRINEIKTVEKLTEILTKLEASKFCKGENKQGWKADFAWFISNGENWIKILEDKYMDREGKLQPPKNEEVGTHYRGGNLGWKTEAF